MRGRKVIGSEGNIDFRSVKVKDGRYDGATIYLVPGVPTRGVFIESEKDIPLEEAIDITLNDIPLEQRAWFRERVSNILSFYRGRVIDVSSILIYALDQGRFDEFAERLEKYDILRIPPQLRMARTDVTAFIHEIYNDLNIPGKEEARSVIDFNKKYGPGVLTFPQPLCAGQSE